MDFLKLITLISILLVGCEVPPKLPPANFTSTKYFQACDNKNSDTLNCAFLDKGSRKFKTEKLVIAKFTRLTYSKEINTTINWSGLVMIDCDKSEIAYKYVTQPESVWSNWKNETEQSPIKKIINEACKRL